MTIRVLDVKDRNVINYKNLKFDSFNIGTLNYTVYIIILLVCTLVDGA